MWIFFPDAMLSIVAHRAHPDWLMVRARFKGDIERVFPGAKAKRTPRADYLYRAEVKRGVVGTVLLDRAQSMAYTNVKGAIPAGDHRRNLAMHDTWQVMFNAQHEAEPYARMDERAKAEAEAIDLHSGAWYSHTTARGEPRTVQVVTVQERLKAEPLATLWFRESSSYYSMPLSRAQRWLRNAELLP